jgi:colanic acid/amylovoran biosynthesis glycosyltransferase
VSFYGSDASRLPTEPGWARRYRHLAQGAAAFTAVSSAMREALVAMGFPAARTHVVYMGLDVEAFAFRPRTEAGLRLVAVGRLVEKKGFLDAISALYHLRRQGHDATLRIVGDGPVRDALERHAGRLGIRGLVRFAGERPHSEVREALHDADVMLAPSVTAPDGDREGMPNTVLEALAAGVPVVATRHAGIPEVIEDGKTGLLVDEHAPEQVAAAVLRYGDAPDLVARVSREGRARVARDFTVAAYVARTEAVYEVARAGAPA